VLLGIVIVGYAWMMPKSSGKSKETEFVSEAAYDRLLEDLENENRELVDAVSKFKREQDDTVEKLGRRLVDMEHQMTKWLEEAPGKGASSSSDSSNILTETDQASVPSDSSRPTVPAVPASQLEPVVEVVNEETTNPPLTIRGRYPELLELHEKGRSIEQIAIAMGMNKGEVQLILQLVRREEQQHA